VSERRSVVQQIAENMGDEGYLARDFTLTDEMRAVLAEMVAERRGDPEMTYAENRITDVLAWLVDEKRGRPQGPERRRLQSLVKQLEKALLTDGEIASLRKLAAQWQSGADEPGAREAADEIVRILDGEGGRLSEEARAYVSGRADYWEGLYRTAMGRLAEVSVQVLAELVGEGARIDHPHIYQYAGLLRHRFEGIRASVEEGTWLLRHSRFTTIFLSEFAETAAVNPVMATETSRLTKEEHERVMKRENTRRRSASIRMLGRIGVDYIKNPESYSLGVRDSDAFVQRYVVHTLEQIAEDDSVAEEVASSLAMLREADANRPGGARFFEQERR
jgi:hypothetical protein